MNEQLGFLSRRSNDLNLKGFSNNLSDILDAGGKENAVYSDFSKTFLVKHFSYKQTNRI